MSRYGTRRERTESVLCFEGYTAIELETEKDNIPAEFMQHAKPQTNPIMA